MGQTIRNGAALLMAMLCAVNAAWAGVTNVTGSSSNQRVATGVPTSAPVVWQVTDQFQPPLSAVRSSFGVFRSTCGQGAELGRVNVPLFRSQTTNNQTFVHQISEVVLIPADVTLRAQRTGAQTICYERTFENVNDLGSSAGSVNFDLTSSAAASLAVARLALSFDNGAPARVLALNEPLGAFAEVTFTGTGLLQAQWEIAGPASTAGTPVFRVLSQVRQYLASGDTVTFRSPPLPTNAAGLHFVRLRITDPAPGFQPPEVRYFVLESRAGRDLPGRALALGSPPPRALLVPDSVFSWEPIRGARAYQLEIYDTGEPGNLGLPDLDNASGEPRPGEIAQALSRPAVTGVYVTGRETRTALAPNVRAHLLPGRRYFWRVLAIGDEGAVIGVSPMRELRTP